MNAIFKTLFSDTIFNSGVTFAPFNVFHFIYIFLAIAFVITSYLILKKKDKKTKMDFLSGLAFTIVFLYLSDFFFHDFVYGAMSTDKLPFHICTVLCPIVGFAQFNKKLEFLKTPAAYLAIVGSFMYLCFPNIGECEPWCYRAIQTIAYHVTLLSWGLFNIIFGQASTDIKKCWQPAAMLGCITIWAKLGNLIYYFDAEKSFNWFFLEKDAFYLGLVENNVLPQWTLMIITPAAVFLVVLAVYGIVNLVKKYTQVPNASPETAEEQDLTLTH